MEFKLINLTKEAHEIDLPLGKSFFSYFPLFFMSVSSVTSSPCMELKGVVCSFLGCFFIKDFVLNSPTE